MPPKQLSIGDLPDAVLSLILRALVAPADDQPCFTLLGGSWLEAQPFSRQAAWLAASHNLLRRVGRHVEAFAAYECSSLEVLPAGVAGGWGLQHFLHLLSPVKLTALTIQSARQSLPAGAAEAIARLTGLTALHFGGAASPGADTLRALTRLARLGINGGPGTDRSALLSAVGGLRSLSWLNLNTNLRDASVAPLLGLARLRHLTMFGSLRFDMAQPLPDLSALPLLETYELGGFHFEDHIMSPAEYQAGALRLSSSQSGSSERHPLRPALLRALLPHRLPLTRLILSSCGLEHTAQACSQLSSLAALELCDCFTSKETRPVSDGALSGVLRQAPHLTELVIEGSLGGEVPECFEADLPDCLRRLSLRGNELQEMPGGWWLRDLVELDLGGNCFSRLPPHFFLSTPRLTRLALDDNPDLVFTLADARELLESAAALAELQLGAESLLAPRVRDALLQGRPGLRLQLTWGDTESEGTTSSCSDGEDEGSKEEAGQSSEEEAG
ncbi:hypothetical protein ABPG75_003795 [Micractinium tetrahymenae]